MAINRDTMEPSGDHKGGLEKADAAFDKRHGIAEDSARDNKIDKAHGVVEHDEVANQGNESTAGSYGARTTLPKSKNPRLND